MPLFFGDLQRDPSLENYPCSLRAWALSLGFWGLGFREIPSGLRFGSLSPGFWASGFGEGTVPKDSAPSDLI